MSKIDELIQEFCPNGCKFFALKDVSISLSGMHGVSKKWENEGNVRFIDYLNVYRNLKVDVKDLPFATLKSTHKQTTVKKFDILFTSASETPDECAISSVVEGNLNPEIFLDDHLFLLRINDEFSKKINTIFLNYYFRSKKFRNDVRKSVRGVTRFYISVSTFMNLFIPIPPIEVQNEIVRILDNFTSLTAELTAELTARKKQYEYYRDYLINNSKSKKITIDKLCLVSAGGDAPKEAFSKEKTNEYNIPIISNGIGKNAFYGFTNNSKISNAAVTVASRGTIGYAEYRDYKYFPIIRLLSLIPKDSNILNTKYLFYSLQGKKYNVPKTGIPQLTSPMMKKVTIPLPPIKEQERIVSILDKFDAYCNDLTTGLPAEIEMRKKQYEYYRDKLLTFKSI